MFYSKLFIVGNGDMGGGSNIGDAVDAGDASEGDIDFHVGDVDFQAADDDFQAADNVYFGVDAEFGGDGDHEVNNINAGQPGIHEGDGEEDRGDQRMDPDAEDQVSPKYLKYEPFK
jgi:hypothetical protein